MFRIRCTYRRNTVRQALSFFINDHTTPLKCLHDTLMSADELGPFFVVHVVFLKTDLCIFRVSIFDVFYSEIYFILMAKLEGCTRLRGADNNCPLLLPVAGRKLEPKVHIR